MFQSNIGDVYVYNHVSLTVYYHEDTGLMNPGKRIVKVVNTFHSVIQLSGNIRHCILMSNPKQYYVC